MSTQLHSESLTELRSEPVYQYTAHFTRVVEYGVSMEALLSGQAAPPPEGARFDISFEGPVSGTRLRGSIKGVDYLEVRADGRFQLHIHAEITTEDGTTIAMTGDGVGTGEPPVMQLRENATLTTSGSEHSWLNRMQVWGSGTVDVSQGQVQISGYLA